MAESAKVLPEDFTRVGEMDALSEPMRKYELSRELFAVQHCLSFDSNRRNNLTYLDEKKGILCLAVGNTVQILTPDTRTASGYRRDYFFGCEGMGIGCIAVHPKETYLAIGEKGGSGAK